MCDKCGNIFSENEDGWSTFSGTVQRRRDDGTVKPETMSQDACAACTSGVRPVAPRLAIPAQATAQTAVDNHHSHSRHPRPDYDRIAELERQNGISPDFDDVSTYGGTTGGGL